MNRTEDIIDIIGNLLQGQRFGALSTECKRHPYANLVAFASTEDLRYILFVTGRQTRKFYFISQNTRVAMLIDNRTNGDVDIRRAHAVTAVGKSEFLTPGKFPNLEDIYLSKHPQLAEFFSSPSTSLIRITVKTYYLVMRFQEVVEYHV